MINSGREAASTARLEQLLAAHPDAGVAAVSADGFFVPVPSGVPVRSQRFVHGHATALELVTADDLHLVVSAWQDAHVHGISQVTVRPLGAESSQMTIHYIDAQAEHGVFLCVFDGDLDHLADRAGEVGEMRPRVATVRKNHQAVFVDVDEAFCRMLGYDDLVGTRNLDLVHPEDQPRAIANWMDMLAAPGESRRVRLRQRHHDGHWVWFEITNHNLLNDPGAGFVVAEMLDVSDEMAALEFLRAQERLLRTLTESLPVGVAQLGPDGVIVHRNRCLADIVGQAGAVSAMDLFTGVADEHRSPLTAAITGALAGEDHDLDVAIERADGRYVHCQVRLRALPGDGAILCIDDTTEQSVLAARLRHGATHDPLTNCYNRAFAMSEIERILESGAGLAVTFIDLDGFKSVNDTLGHSAGDAMLQAIAHELQQVTRTGDEIARIGGDEFLVLSPGITSAQAALTTAQRLADALAAAVTPSTGHRAVASIGVSYTEAGERTSAERLVDRADSAMYRSKAGGSGRPELAERDEPGIHGGVRTPAGLRARAPRRDVAHVRTASGPRSAIGPVEDCVRPDGDRTLPA